MSRAAAHRSVALALALALGVSLVMAPAMASSPTPDPSPAFTPASVSDGVVTRTVLGPLEDDPYPIEDDPFERTEVVDVVAGGPGFVAVGNAPRGPVVWLSADGVTWDRVPDSPALDGGYMRAIAAGGPGLVAVGQDDTGAAVWVSSGGTTWERVTDDSFRTSAKGWPLCAYETFMGDVTRLADGSMLAVGYTHAPDGGGRSTPGSSSGLVDSRGGSACASGRADPSGPVMWRSLDGRDWQRLRADGPIPDTVAALGNGWVGRPLSGDRHLVVSRDGRRSRTVRLGFRPGTVVASGGDLYTVSRSGQAMTSPDGVRWRKLGPPLPAGVFAGKGLAVTDDTLYLGAYEESTDTAGLWASTVGSPWARLESDLLDGDGPGRLVAGEGRVVGIGSLRDPIERWLPAAWTLPPAAVDPARPAPARAPWVDPSTVSWTPLELADTRRFASVARLRDGRVLLAGPYGPDEEMPGLESWFLDPATGQLARAADLPEGAEGSEVSVAPDGRTYLVTELRDGEALRVLSWDPKSGASDEVAPEIKGYYPRPTWLPDGRLLLGGILLDPDTGVLDEVSDPAPSLTTGPVNSAGQATVGFSRSRAWRLDPQSGWQPGAANPHLLEHHQAAPLADGRIAVLATVHAPTCEPRLITLLDLYDPRTDAWTTGFALPQARSRAYAVQVADGRLLILGGERPYVEEPCLSSTEPLTPAILVDLPEGD